MAQADRQAQDSRESRSTGKTQDVGTARNPRTAQGQEDSRTDSARRQESWNWSAARHLTMDWGSAAILVVALVPALVSLIPGAASLAAPIVSALLAVCVVATMAVAGRPSAEPASPLSMSVFAAIWGVVGIAYGLWDALRLPELMLSQPDRKALARDLALPWLQMTVVALTVLIISGFLFEMLRKERTHLIASLGLIALAGTCAWTASGWVLVSALLSLQTGALGWVLLAISVAVDLLIAFAFQIAVTDLRFRVTKGIDSGHSAGATAIRSINPRGISLAMAMCATGLAGVCVPLFLLI